MFYIPSHLRCCTGQVLQRADFHFAGRQRFEERAPVALGEDAPVEDGDDAAVGLGADQAAKALAEAQDGFRQAGIR